MKGKKAQVVLYIYFMIAALILIVIAGLFAPIGVRFNTEMLEAGENILYDTIPTINNINDPALRTQINNTVYSAIDAGANNVEVNANIFQYSWVIVLVLSAIIVFMQTRRLIEVGAGGFV